MGGLKCHKLKTVAPKVKTEENMNIITSRGLKFFPSSLSTEVPQFIVWCTSRLPWITFIGSCSCSPSVCFFDYKGLYLAPSLQIQMWVTKTTTENQSDSDFFFLYTSLGLVANDCLEPSMTAQLLSLQRMNSEMSCICHSSLWSL